MSMLAFLHEHLAQNSNEQLLVQRWSLSAQVGRFIFILLCFELNRAIYAHFSFLSGKGLKPQSAL